MVTQPWPPPNVGAWIAKVREGPCERWLLNKLIPTDGVTLVSGPAKLGKKTLAVMALVRVLAAGKDITDGPDVDVRRSPTRILMFEYEGPCVALADDWDWFDTGTGWVCPRDGILWAHRYHHVRITDPEWADRICSLVQADNIKLVVVHTFTRAAQAPENDAQAMSAAFEQLARICEATHGGAVLYIHHLRKPSQDNWDEDIDESVRGSGVFSATYDQHQAFRAGRNSVHLLTRSKVDEERFFRWTWNIDAERKAISFQLEEFDVNAQPPSNLVSSCMDAFDSENVHTLRQLAELWDVPATVAQWLASSLSAGGLLTRTAKGFKKT